MTEDKLRNELIASGLKQKEIAEILGVSLSTVSALLSGKQKPTKQHKIIWNLYHGERQPFKNTKIEAVAQIMEELDPAAQEDILRIAEKEKQIAELKRDQQNRKAA